jgi:hypothetical protein
VVAAEHIAGVLEGVGSVVSAAGVEFAHLGIVVQSFGAGSVGVKGSTETVFQVGVHTEICRCFQVAPQIGEETQVCLVQQLEIEDGIVAHDLAGDLAGAADCGENEIVVQEGRARGLGMVARCRLWVEAAGSVSMVPAVERILVVET